MDEEMDFIINCDIKCRMGHDAEGDSVSSGAGSDSEPFEMSDVSADMCAHMNDRLSSLKSLPAVP